MFFKYPFAVASLCLFQNAFSYPLEESTFNETSSLEQRGLFGGPKVAPIWSGFGIGGNTLNDIKVQKRIVEAFEDALEMLAEATAFKRESLFSLSKQDEGPFPYIVRTYFPRGSATTVGAVLDTYNAAFQSGKINQIRIDRRDIFSTCVDENGGRHTYAYIEPTQGIMHFCNKALFGQPRLKDLSCNSLGNRVSSRMDSFEATILHELFHWQGLGDQVTRYRISDYAYGAANSQRLASDPRAIYNADSYTWFVIETYFTRKCLNWKGGVYYASPY